MKHFIYSFLFLVTTSFTMISASSCSDEDTEDNSNNLIAYMSEAQSDLIPVELVEKSELPQWLTEMIEAWLPGNGGLLSTYVFTGRWKGETLYLLHNAYMSSHFYHLYDSKGNRLEHGDNREIIDKSSDWKCIYIH